VTFPSVFLLFFIFFGTVAQIGEDS